MAIKVRKTITLEQRADGLAGDITRAIYSAIGTKEVHNLHEGDDLTEVIDQKFGHDGMSDELVRMSHTRLEMHVLVDVSGSMFHGTYGKPIRQAATFARILNRAISTVSDQLPADVFKGETWIWSAGRSGSSWACLSRDGYDGPHAHSFEYTFGNGRNVQKADEVLDKLSTGSIPSWRGGSTQISGVLQALEKWNADLGDVTAHKLDLVITDGEVYDISTASQMQTNRQNGKLRSLMFNVGPWDYVQNIPACFYQFRTTPNELGAVLSEEIFKWLSETL